MRCNSSSCSVSSQTRLQVNYFHMVTANKQVNQLRIAMRSIELCEFPKCKLSFGLKLLGRERRILVCAKGSTPSVCDKMKAGDPLYSASPRNIYMSRPCRCSDLLYITFPSANSSSQPSFGVSKMARLVRKYFEDFGMCFAWSWSVDFITAYTR